MKKPRKSLNNYLTVLIDTRLESSFISLGKREIKEGRRRACAPPAYLKLPFSLPTGEGRGGGSLFNHELFPVLYIYTLREHGGHRGSRGHRDSSAREVVGG